MTPKNGTAAVRVNPCFVICAAFADKAGGLERFCDIPTFCHTFKMHICALNVNVKVQFCA